MRIIVAALAALSVATTAKADAFSGFYAGIVASSHQTQSTGAIHEIVRPGDWGMTPGLFAVGYYPSKFNLDVDGTSLGVVFGHGAKYGSLYFGIEGDVSASSRRDSFGVSHPITLILTPPAVPGLYSDYRLSTSIESNWYATIRPRFGLALSDDVMIFATAGVAAMHAKIIHSMTSGVWFQSNTIINSSIRFGPVIGGGLDIRLATQFAIRAEYLFAKIGDVDIETNGPHRREQFVYRYNLDNHILRMAILTYF